MLNAPVPIIADQTFSLLNLLFTAHIDQVGEVVRAEPDRAVGRVIESSRNGVIQKGDNVTTKL
jgi:hypothetical protein